MEYFYSKVESMTYMFNGLHNLTSFPDISNWNVSKVFTMIAMFRECKSIEVMPDISK